MSSNVFYLIIQYVITYDGSKYLMCFRTFAFVKIRVEAAGQDRWLHKIESVDMTNKILRTDGYVINVLQKWTRGVQANALFFRKVSLHDAEQQQALDFLNDNLWKTDSAEGHRLPLDEEYVVAKVRGVNRRNTVHPEVLKEREVDEIYKCPWASNLCIQKVTAEKRIESLIRKLLTRPIPAQTDGLTCLNTRGESS